MQKIIYGKIFITNSRRALHERGAREITKKQHVNSSESEKVDLNDDSEELLDDEEYLIDEIKPLLYKNRIRELIKDVASSDGLDLRISKEGFQRYHDSVKFLSVVSQLMSHNT